MSGDDGTLFDPPATKSRRRSRSGGDVYKGVDLAIKTLEDLGVVDASRHAGLCAQARSLAGSIDRESGADETRKQASGVSLAALHAQLSEVLARLDPQGDLEDGTDKAWRDFQEAMQAPPQASPVQVEP